MQEFNLGVGFLREHQLVMQILQLREWGWEDDSVAYMKHHFC